MNKVYGVWKSGWGDWQLYGSFASQGVAEAWANKLNSALEDSDFGWHVEETEVKNEGPSPE